MPNVASIADMLPQGDFGTLAAVGFSRRFDNKRMILI